MQVALWSVTCTIGGKSILSKQSWQTLLTCWACFFSNYRIHFFQLIFEGVSQQTDLEEKNMPSVVEPEWQRGWKLSVVFSWLQTLFSLLKCHLEFFVDNFADSVLAFYWHHSEPCERQFKNCSCYSIWGNIFNGVGMVVYILYRPQILTFVMQNYKHRVLFASSGVGRRRFNLTFS